MNVNAGNLWNKKMWLGLILISAFFVRFTHFGIHRFHEDEALYASWGIRIFEHYDLLLNGASGVDKPPLLFYLQAIAYLFFGITENAARIPNLIAGVVSVSLIYKIGKYYFNEKTGLDPWTRQPPAISKNQLERTVQRKALLKKTPNYRKRNNS